MTESFVDGVGGVAIYRRAWLPDGEAGLAEGRQRGVVVIAHGAGEHSGRYQRVAARLVGEGYAVYALDHRGHGRSEGPRALIDRIDNAVADLDSLVVDAADQHPDTPVFLLGHSMGGTIALCYALRHQERLAGLALSGPLAALDSAPLPLRVAVRTLSAVAPRVPLIGVDPSLISRDPAVVQDYTSDPLVHHGRLPVRTVAELARVIDAFPNGVAAIRVQTLIMYGTADRLCPPRGSEMLRDRIGAVDKTAIPYEGLAHEILNEPEQARVMDDLCGWLGARAGTPAM